MARRRWTLYGLGCVSVLVLLHAPASAGGVEATGLPMLNSVGMTGDAEQLRILRKAWQAKFARLLRAPTSRPGLGKTYSTTVLGCPETIHLLSNERNEPEVSHDKRP